MNESIHGIVVNLGNDKNQLYLSYRHKNIRPDFDINIWPRKINFEFINS